MLGEALTELTSNGSGYSAESSVVGGLGAFPKWAGNDSKGSVMFDFVM